MKKTNAGKIKIAVTGNIGSGKSTFIKYLSEKGFPVIHADDISKDILTNDPAARKKIIEEFGAEVYEGNKVNKSYLSNQIFLNPDKLEKINSILHPLVREKINSLAMDFFKTNDFVFVETALVYESRIEKMFDFIVLIIADKEIRLNRIVSSNNLTKEEFINRNENQIDDKRKIKKADFIFTNNGTIDELKIKADLLITLLNSLKN